MATLFFSWPVEVIVDVRRDTRAAFDSDGDLPDVESLRHRAAGEPVEHALDTLAVGVARVRKCRSA